ncbi:lysostaphin resistance A-like protein [Anoxybacillus sp. D401a]|uniref:CPBP family intramembrane glutamic endopeptidase n=1 Tax=Anoxybacillus sp. D401a TaxID=575112 RepID=UPI003D33692F
MKLLEKEKVNELFYGGNIVIGSYISLFLLTVIVTFFTHGGLFNVKYNDISLYPIKSLIAISFPMFITLCLFPLIIEKRMSKCNLRDIGFVHFSEIGFGSKGVIVVCICIIIAIFVYRPMRGIPPLFIHYLIVGFGEEILFRGIFQRRLQKVFNPYISIVITSFVFAFQFHATGSLIDNLFVRFPLGLLLGFIYYRSKNMWTISILKTKFGKKQPPPSLWN